MVKKVSSSPKTASTSTKTPKISKMEKITFLTMQLAAQLENSKPKTTKLKDHFRETYVQDANGKSVSAWEIQRQYGNDNNSYIPQINNNYFSQLNNLLVNNTFIGWGELALIAQHPIINAVCRTKANEATNKWIEFFSTSETDDKENKIKELTKEFDRLGVKEHVNRAFYYSYLMGQYILYPKLKDDESDEEKKKPLIMEDLKIPKGGLEYIQGFDPTFYVPINYNKIGRAHV